MKNDDFCGAPAQLQIDEAEDISRYISNLPLTEYEQCALAINVFAHLMAGFGYNMAAMQYLFTIGLSGSPFLPKKQHHGGNA